MHTMYILSLSLSLSLSLYIYILPRISAILPHPPLPQCLDAESSDAFRIRLFSGFVLSASLRDTSAMLVGNAPKKNGKSPRIPRRSCAEAAQREVRLLAREIP